MDDVADGTRAGSTATVRLAQLVARTEAEGPGVRFALWTQGCPLRCDGCCNPEMFSFEGGEPWETGAVVEAIRGTRGIEGVSFLGGEPVAQAAPLARLARCVQDLGLSVVLFTGYALEELRGAARPDIDSLLAATDLVIDGRYERRRPETRRRWIGSSNQRLHFLSARYSPSDPCFGQPNTLEVRWRKGSLEVNGWPDLAAALTRRH